MMAQSRARGRWSITMKAPAEFPIPFRSDQVFIGGAWQAPACGETLALENPSDGSELACIARGGAADIDAAVRAARAALDSSDPKSWGRLSALERGRVLLEISHKVMDNVELLAGLE